MHELGATHGFVAAPLKGKLYAFATPDQVVEAFGENLIAPSGSRSHSMARLITGWRLIWSNKYDCAVLARTPAAFSVAHELLLCHVEEHVMASSAELWSGGRRKWWVSHEGEDGPRGLDTEGELPECFASIRDEMENAQRAEGGDDADVDYIFEIPLKVAQTLVGFKHDENYDSIIEGRFFVLSQSAEKKGFLSRLLGK